MKPNWKTLFITSLILNVALVIGGSYLVFSLALTSGHSHENLLIVEDDMKCVSKALENKAKSYEEFCDQLTRQNCIYESKKNQFIRLTLVRLVFDEKGNLTRIET